ncbi:MAG TPA: NUDIX domain-containing protein [Caulobacteraceae bacterium]|jgi:8-oxo-dGTP diphosphatase|nr:NUDIX domain-containing protein [Caulobacteraceae bacterium]
MAANEPPPSSEGPLQFGRRQPGLVYLDRPSAFGVAAREDGRIALVKVERPEGTWRDLPGGAVDPGEDEPAALVREFGEETGLVVRCGPLIARADQYFLKSDGAPVNNRSGVYLAELAGEDQALKIEPDHALEWWDPAAAIGALRHDSHAWAAAAWLRLRRPLP